MEEPFQVGDFTVEPELNRIRCGDKSVHVESKAMEVLVYLSQHPKEVLHKERIIQAGWPDVSVTDDVPAPTHAISELRNAFEEDARESSVHRRFRRKVGTSQAAFESN